MIDMTSKKIEHRMREPRGLVFDARVDGSVAIAPTRVAMYSMAMKVIDFLSS